MNDRARRNLMNYIFQFFLSRKYGDEPRTSGGFGNKYFIPMDEPRPGDLVALSSAPFTEWYLSWYVEHIDKGDHFSNIHVLESIETGRLCNWSNCSFMIMNREMLEDHPEWKWTDKQFEFRDKWYRACRRYGKYDLVAMPPEFMEDGSALLRARRKFDWGPRFCWPIPNWKKALVRDMREGIDHYDENTH